jgi:hypothetical protein
MDELQQLSNLVVAEEEIAKALQHQLPSEKRKPRTEMQAQTHFSADGPALFMEGETVSVTLLEHTVEMRLWRQPRKYEEHPSRRVLRLRGNGSITSNP